MNREKLGSFWVDTATVLVGEPCVLIADPPRIDYAAFAGLFQGEPAEDEVVTIKGEEFRFGRREARKQVASVDIDGVPRGFGVSVGTDGYCHVFVERDRHGDVKRIII